MDYKVILFSRRNRSTRGGVELFNENLLSLMGNDALHVSEISSKENLLVSYSYRIFQTIRLFRKNSKSTIIVQYGSFIDILAIIVLRIFCGRLYAIAHVSDTWKHLSTKFRRRVCAKLLDRCLVKLLILAETQKEIFHGVRMEKIRTIIHPVFAENSNFEGPRDFFLYVGRITPEKGVLDIIDAWDLLGSNAPKLVVAGGGEEDFLDKFIDRIRRFPRQDLISFIGSIRDPYELRELYRKAKAVIYPSYSDAFPLVMLEALSQKTPVIISRVGEVKSFLEDYELLVNPGNTEDIIQAVATICTELYDMSKILVHSERARSFADGAIIDDFVNIGILPKDYNAVQ